MSSEVISLSGYLLVYTQHPSGTVITSSEKYEDANAETFSSRTAERWIDGAYSNDDLGTEISFARNGLFKYFIGSGYVEHLDDSDNVLVRSLTFNSSMGNVDSNGTPLVSVGTKYRLTTTSDTFSVCTAHQHRGFYIPFKVFPFELSSGETATTPSLSSSWACLHVVTGSIQEGPDTLGEKESLRYNSLSSLTITALENNTKVLMVADAG